MEWDDGLGAGMKVGRSIDNASNSLRSSADELRRQGGSIGKMAISKGSKR